MMDIEKITTPVIIGNHDKLSRLEMLLWIMKTFYRLSNNESIKTDSLIYILKS